MRLNDIKDNPGSRKLRVRIGRGIGSGMGKMGGRGGKGQTARAGVRLGGFEGGQMPLHRRLPKRGFNKLNAKHYNEINLGRLQEAIDSGRLDAGKPIDIAALMAAGLVRRALDGVRVLGEGELKAKLALTVDHATASAKAAIEKAGGSITLIERQKRLRPASRRRPPARTRVRPSRPLPLAPRRPVAGGSGSAVLLALNLSDPHVLRLPARAGRTAVGKGRERSHGFRRRTACFQSEFRGVREG
jgi:large subunit ribosomal protein L15